MSRGTPSSTVLLTINSPFRIHQPIMQRRQFLQATGLTLGAGLAFTGLKAASPLTRHSLAQSGTLEVEWLFHSCVIFRADNLNILVNPFRPIGCTEGYPMPDRPADLVLLSSRLLDEGAITSVVGNPRVLFEAGDFRVNGLRIQGVRMDHDDQGGARFGQNIAWRWQMGGIDVVHLGGAAAPLTREQEILLEKPDLLFVPVGGGPKNYDAEGAIAAIEALEPKVVVPTMYRTERSGEECELDGIDSFLSSLSQASVTPLASNRMVLSPSQLPESGIIVNVFPT